MADTDNPRSVLEEVRRHLSKNGMSSLSELERSIGARNWLSGFMAALEALGVVECRGTRTFKIYVLGKTLGEKA